MSVHAVVAVRGGPLAKTRCADVLNEEQRKALVMTMIEDMIAALARVDAIDHIYVVTPTTAIVERVRGLGATPLVEHKSYGLNAAFELARFQISGRDPNGQLMLFPGDLPLLDPAEMDELITSFQPDELVFVATDDGGTGALLLPAHAQFKFCFGPNSAARHREAASIAGLKPIAYTAPSLAFDVDTWEDIKGLCRQTGNSRTTQYLRGLQLAEECTMR